MNEKNGKPVICVNRNTGEIIDDWEVILTDEKLREDDTRVRVFARGTSFDEGNVGYWQDDERDTRIVEPVTEFGPASIRDDKRKFTMVYQMEEPNLSTDRFYRYWLRIERNIEMNTGVIVRRDTQGRIYRISTIDDWVKLLEGSRRSVMDFRKECERQGHVARFTWADHLYWIVNPKYHWNGKFIPKPIHALFREKEVTTCVS